MKAEKKITLKIIKKNGQPFASRSLPLACINVGMTQELLQEQQDLP